jgi:hypothetical protein
VPMREIHQTECLKPEKVAYWYFRLNGFLQIENFIVHPGRRGGQRTDADLLAVRFPHRRELFFDPAQPMQDDTQILALSPDCIDVFIAEIKTNQPCSLNGPWSNKDHKNVHRVLAAIRCFQEQELSVAASAIYENGAFHDGRVQIRLVAVGRNRCAKLAGQYDEIIQLTWEHMLYFVWKRFYAYRNQKSDVEQWGADWQKPSLNGDARTRAGAVRQTGASSDGH